VLPAPPHRKGGSVLSEYYQLRRTAIKDLAAYCGFLVGFLGSAPFAWQQLAAQLEAGNFSRGLWYFLLFVSAAGVFTGTAGLGVGFMIGWAWEQYHRRRRNMRLKDRAAIDAVRAANAGAKAISATEAISGTEAPASAGTDAGEQPRLRLVPAANVADPDVMGHRLTSVRFRAQTVEFDFAGVVVESRGHPIVLSGSQRFRYPEEGSRDALCRLIGATVDEMRVSEGDDIELTLDDGSGLVLPRPRSQPPR
jgi:hypothetical protein